MSRILNIILITEVEDERVSKLNKWLQNRYKGLYDDITLKEISRHASGNRCLERHIWATAINYASQDIDEFVKVAESLFQRYGFGDETTLYIKDDDEGSKVWKW